MTDTAGHQGELRLARGIRLRHDKVRNRWVLLGPERGYVLNESGRGVVQALIDGREPDVAADAFIDDLVARRLVERK